MKTVRINFPNADGELLSARLSLPVDQHPKAYALFAHCFTCNKNLSAVRNIGRGLTQNGIAVLRFDFTGLGESEGNFANTNFSSNIQDLICAADYLKNNYKAPCMLIGHSLGGAASILAACEIESVRAVATIGAPSDPIHVKHLFKDDIDSIEDNGVATVSIGGRSFTIKKQFIDDLKKNDIKTVLQKMRGKSLLVMHSPQDKTVEVTNAAQIYDNAFHPKSFISLDGADHLLSNKDDSLYVGNVIASWAQRYLGISEPKRIHTTGDVAVRLGNEDKFTAEVKIGPHYLKADEPLEFGGNDFGPAPYEFVSAGLGACTVMTMRMYADRKKWDLQEATVHLHHSKKTVEQDGKKVKVDVFERQIEVEGNLDEKQIERLAQIADKCPVHKTLTHGSEVTTVLKLKK